MKHRHVIIIALISLLATAAAGCRRSHGHAVLDRIDSVIAVEPSRAMAMLDSVAPEFADAGTPETMRHRLLSIKAADKAYVTHTSDSLIRPVLDYYADRTSDTLRHVALYYGGRVYADIGDSPRALEYFRLALDAIPTGTHLKLRSVIIDQMRWIYGEMRIFPRELEYARMYLDIALQLNDTMKIVQGWSTLGGAYSTIRKMDSTAVCYEKAHKYAVEYGNRYVIEKFNMQLLSFYSKTGQSGRVDSLLANGWPEGIKYNHLLPTINTIKASVFKTKEQWDSSMVYSLWEIQHGSDKTVMFGHGDLAECYLHMNQPDKANEHLKRYHVMLDSLRKEENQAMILQQESLYNYSLREQENERLKHESLRNRLVIVSLALILVIAGLLYGLIYYRQKLRLMRTQTANENLRLMKNKLEEVVELTRSRLRIAEEDRDELSAALKKYKDAESIGKISTSKVVAFIRGKVELPLDASLPPAEWARLESLFDEVLPVFMSRMRRLGLTQRELNMTMLLKLGFGVKDIGVLLGCSESSVSMMRLRLARTHNRGESSKDWDKFVQEQ